DLGFCEKGQGGRFVSDGNLVSGVGKLPLNTDGGGLCNNHPSNRGGLTKVLEAVRQLRGEAHPAVQVKNCDIALAHGTGGSLGTRHAAATVVMERECARWPRRNNQPNSNSVRSRRRRSIPKRSLSGIRPVKASCSTGDAPAAASRIHNRGRIV